MMENHGKTFFGNKGNGKFAILELSTKAVKRLIGPERDFFEENGFDFRYFYRKGELSHTGRCLDEQMYMKVGCFKKNVLPIIKNAVREIRKQGINEVYTVATAAYRNAKNRDHILKLIFEETGINVKILEKKQEAFMTLLAFYFSKPGKVELNNHVLLLDQGGGSTEVSLFKGQDLLYSNSFDMGTTLLINNHFFKDMDLSIPEAHEVCKRIISDHVMHELNIAELSSVFEPITAVAVGTAITTATKRKGNKNQHGISFDVPKLKKAIDYFEKILTDSFDDLRSLKKNLEKRNEFDKYLVAYVGLPFFVEIMEMLDIETLYVNGTGLWYGAYFKNLFDIEIEEL